MGDRGKWFYVYWLLFDIFINSAGLTRRAVGSAFIVSIGTIGGAIGGQIYYGKQIKKKNGWSGGNRNNEYDTN